MNTFNILANETNTTLLVEAMRSAIELYKTGVTKAAIRARNDGTLYGVFAAPEDMDSTEHNWYYASLSEWISETALEVRQRTGILFNEVNYFDVAELYSNANSFKIVGVKSKLHNTLLNIHVDVASYYNERAAFYKSENVGHVTDFSVCDSRSTSLNHSCWAEDDKTKSLSNERSICDLIAYTHVAIRKEISKPLIERKLTNLRFATI